MTESSSSLWAQREGGRSERPHRRPAALLTFIGVFSLEDEALHPRLTEDDLAAPHTAGQEKPQKPRGHWGQPLPDPRRKEGQLQGPPRSGPHVRAMHLSGKGGTPGVCELGSPASLPAPGPLQHFLKSSLEHSTKCLLPPDGPRAASPWRLLPRPDDGHRPHAVSPKPRGQRVSGLQHGLLGAVTLILTFRRAQLRCEGLQTRILSGI